MNKPTTIIIIFFVGVLIGIAGAIAVPKYMRPYLPESIVGKETTVKGIVVAKSRKGTSLLLTVNTPQGALLSTMNRKVDEIDLLVNVDDEIEFTLKSYEPFINDPKIKRVVKDGDQQWSSEEEKTLEVAPEKAVEKKATPAEPAEKEKRELKTPKEETTPPPPAVPEEGKDNVKPQDKKTSL